MLMLGADGIAVGLSTAILPHNFIELLEAQIEILREKKRTPAELNLLPTSKPAADGYFRLQ